MEARELSIEVSVLSPLFEISSRKILPPARDCDRE